MSTITSKSFQCTFCDFVVDYNFYGRKPPFAKCIVLLEDCYVMKDPFSTSGGYISVGGHCTNCKKPVCMSSDCSLFYTQRFCLNCAEKCISEFPLELQQELLQKTKDKG